MKQLITQLKRLQENEKGFVLVGTIMVAVLAAMVGISILISSSGEILLVKRKIDMVQSLYVTESAINGIALRLKSPDNWDDTAWSGISSVTTPVGSALLDSIIFTSGGVVSLTVTGTYQGEQRRILATIRATGSGNGAPPAAASFRAASPKVNGNLQVDGRNHDRNCNLIANGSGTYAIALATSAGDFTFTGSADLGASDGGIDYGMAHTTDHRVIYDVADMPQTPDQVFGSDEGTLEQKAIDNGAYYLNPGSGDFVAVDGVNYVDMPCGSIWQPNSIAMDDPSSEAILVVHSSCGDSVYKAVGGGFLRGMLIVDNLDKLHGQVIGAIVGVGTGTSGINLGNGPGSVCYSSDVTNEAQSGSGLLGSLSVELVSWKEIQL